MPLCKWDAVNLNSVSRSKVKVLAELCEKSLSRSHILSPWSNLGHTSTTECLVSAGCAVTLNDVFRSRVKVISDHAKILFSEHTYSPLSSIWLILLINTGFLGKLCSVILNQVSRYFKVKLEGHPF